MELLAPAGEKEIALAALRAGADACYVGGLWSARAYAKNFDERDLLDTLDFAHAHGKKVYVALNTMLDTRELADALSYTGRLYDAGVDAIIAADLGYIAEAHARFPGLALHASTQAGVQSAAGAALLQSLGCTRVVAARECTMADLRAMAQAGIEVEAFCHGAMCSGVSGACLLSGVLGGRSGNRGRCAQPCRQEYRLLGEKGYFLSMKDLCTLDLIAAFDRAGVCSLKIEGRMKKLEYVTSAVASYRRAMDAYAVGRRADTAALRRELSVMFNRGGFSEGYLLGSRDVTYVKKPNHRGLYLGKIADIRGGRGFVRTDWPLQKGDSVEVGTQGFALAYADREGDGFRIAVPRGAAVGQPVYLKASLALLQKAQAAGQGQADFCETAVTLRFSAAEGGMACLEASADGKTARAEAPVRERAQKPAAPDRIRQQLCKTAGLPVRITDCRVALAGAPFLPVSQLNALRREALAALLGELSPAKKPHAHPAAGKPLPPIVWDKQPRYVAAQVCTPAQARAAAAAGADRLYVAPEGAEALQDILSDESLSPMWLVLPPFFDDAAGAWLSGVAAAHRARLAGVVAPNPGAIQAARDLGLAWVADFWTNAANRAAVEALARLGAADVAVSQEIDAARIADLPGNKETVAYGRIPLMNLHHCPTRRAGGCEACGKAELQDKLGYRFPLRRLWGGVCLTQVYNAVPIALYRAADVRRAGVTGLRLVFVDESAEETARVVRGYAAAWHGQGEFPRRDRQSQYSSGHFYRGVE